MLFEMVQTVRQTWFLYLLLFMVATAWGLSNPLAKVAVSTGYQPFGVMFWQLVTILILSGITTFYQHRRLPLHVRHLRLFGGIALVGTLLPDYLVYLSAAQLPAGILSILLGLVPVISLPIALVLRMETLLARRVFGVVLGAMAVVLMIGPDTALPPGTKLIFAILTLLASASYALQGIFVAWHGTRGLDAVQVLFGATTIALCVVAPASVLTGQFVDLWIPWGAAEWALLGTSVLHALAYGGFFALVARAGPVFTSQVAYLVTGSGVLWSMLLLNETYSLWIWAAFGLMLAGIFLLQPKRVRSAR